MRRITRLPYAASVPAPLPLFPLNTPLVPGLVLPLHIFEPRYREMLRDALDTHRLFAVAGLDVWRCGACYGAGMEIEITLPDSR